MTVTGKTTEYRATILLVDDEPNVLKSLTRLFHSDSYTVLTASSGEEAVELVKREPIDAIISDLRMPGMSGSEFLQIASEIEPGVPRLLLSGQRDLDLAIGAVNEGKISQYLEKPWDPQELRTILHQVIEKRFSDLQDQKLSKNISEQNARLKSQNEEATKGRAEAESQSQLKSRFLAMMSHEIRTPITGILGVLEALVDTQMTPEQIDLVNTGINSSLHLKRIVDDSLDMSKLEAGKMSLESIIYSPGELVESAVRLFEPKFKTKGLTIRVEGDHHLPEFLHGDPARIKQVLLNLISNSWKFTETGGIILRVDYSDSALLICIEDTGIGIPPEVRSLLFREFSMLENVHVHQYEGTGLGLAICRKLADLMGGCITHTDNPAGGSRFTVTVPSKEAQSIEVKPGPVAEIKLPENIKVLLVDDNATNLKVIALLLENLGCQVSVASHGADAVQLTTRDRQNQFDLVLMDISMPVLGGVEATRQLRKTFTSEQLPVIAMTAHVVDEDRKTYFEAGMNDVITKPLRKMDLARLLRKFSSCEGTEEIDASLPAVSSLIDTATLSQLLKDVGTGSFHALAESFIGDARTRLKQIQLHDEQGNMENLIREVHTLGSSAGMFGACDLQSQCLQLESRWKSGSDISIVDCEQLTQTIRASIAAFVHWYQCEYKNSKGSPIA